MRFGVFKRFNDCIIKSRQGLPMMSSRIRDILARKGEDVYSVDPLATVIDAVTTARLYAATPDDALLDVMHFRTERRGRQLPAMEGEVLLGLVSIGDLTKAMQHNLCQEVREHSNYIGGPYLS